MSWRALWRVALLNVLCATGFASAFPLRSGEFVAGFWGVEFDLMWMESHRRSDSDGAAGAGGARRGSLCPGGTSDNSPAIYRWDEGRTIEILVPEGRLKRPRAKTPQPSLRDSRPKAPVATRQ